MKITNAGETTSKEVLGPRALQDLMAEQNAELKERLAAHKAEQKTAWYKIKSLFKKSK